MPGGASWQWWIGFHLLVILLLAADVLLPSRPAAGAPGQARSRRAEWLSTGILVLAALAFAVWISFVRGRRSALEFVAGYAIETSLSIDNLFVFLVIFEGLRVSPARQRTALLYGVAGAAVMRAVFIAAGVTLIERFSWITLAFGAFLLYAAWRMLRGGSARAAVPGWVRRLKIADGSLLPIIIAVEATDLLFAVDSIPAVLAVSHDPFVVYTSNIAAILGLRSLYFSLVPLLGRFRYLHYGLGALIAFVALKMLAAPWIEIPITLSLAIIGLILIVCVAVSLAAGRRERD